MRTSKASQPASRAWPNEAPVVNVVAAALVVVSFVPVYLVQRVGGGESAGGRL